MSDPLLSVSDNGGLSVDTRPRVNSFDVFDTLIARRCIEPARIFEQVGAAMNIPDFTAHRRRAEAAVAGGPYTLDDIYRELSGILGLTAERAEALKAAEIAAEMDAAIPVAENIALVNDGDLLLSDMYLGEAVIRRLLTKAGLDKDVELTVTSDGKRSGALWPKLLADYSITRHLGDNRHSDVEVPARFGIASVHTDVAAAAPIETWLIKAGLRDLAQLVREARLASWHRDRVTRRLQLIQIFLNFPILVLSSVRLLNLARELGISRLLFASRDCNMWLPLAQSLAVRMGIACEMEYFYTSRRARVQPSADYLAYARDRLSGHSMLVDTCGTGWSTALLMEALGLDAANTFYIHHLKPATAYERKRPTPKNCTVHSIIGPDKQGFSNPRFEMCNYAEHGSVKDVRFAGGSVVPVFEDDERPDDIRAAVGEQRRCFAGMINLLKNAPLDRTLSLDAPAIEENVAALYRALSREEILPHIYSQSHRAEDERLLRAIGLL